MPQNERQRERGHAPKGAKVKVKQGGACSGGVIPETMFTVITEVEQTVRMVEKMSCCEAGAIS